MQRPGPKVPQRIETPNIEEQPSSSHHPKPQQLTGSAAVNTRLHIHR